MEPENSESEHFTETTAKREMAINYEHVALVMAFGFGAALGYLFAPDNWYHDRVQTCLDLGQVAARECFIGVAEWAYEGYMEGH